MTDEAGHAVDTSAWHHMYAVTGLLVMRVATMERWLYVAASDLRSKHYVKVEDAGAQKVIRSLREVAARLPDTDRRDLVGALDVATEALELRNAVVHGVLLYFDENDSYESQRLPRWAERRDQPDPHNPMWTRRRFRAGDMVTMADAARSVSSLLQQRLSKWCDALGVEEYTPDL